MRIENISLPPLPGTSYQTAPLLGYGVALRERAADRTIGVAPKHGEQCAYFRLAADLNLDQMADFIAICAGAQQRRSSREIQCISER